MRKETPPDGPLGVLGTLGVDVLPVELSAASVHIHVGSPEPGLALPQVSGDPEGSHDEEGKVGSEEVLGSTKVGTDGGDGSVELVKQSVLNGRIE